MVLWEDQRATGKEFGPDLLLKSCVTDDRSENRYANWWKRIEPIPKKGKEKVWMALREDLPDLAAAGAVVAVLDRDRAHELCGLKSRPACKSLLLQPLRRQAPGEYELILLEDRLETLFDACRRALGQKGLPVKPNPNERDDIFRKIAFGPSPDPRKQVRREVPSFDRLVGKVRDLIASLPAG
jgi:hypothetical protein